MHKQAYLANSIDPEQVRYDSCSLLYIYHLILLVWLMSLPVKGPNTGGENLYDPLYAASFFIKIPSEYELSQDLQNMSCRRTA